MMKGAALFILPTDRLGGAESVTRLLAEAAARSARFSVVVCFVLAGSASGTLAEIEAAGLLKVIYSGAKREAGGVCPLVRYLLGRRFDFIFSSHTHVNALLCLLRRIGVLRARRLVTRESTLIFERPLGRSGWWIRKLYWLYGSQDLLVCQTQRMRLSLASHTHNRLERVSVVVGNPIDRLAIGKSVQAAKPIPIKYLKNVFRIIWCGRLCKVKRPDWAIRVLAALHRSGMGDAHLIMLGEGPLRSCLMQLAHSEGISDHLTMAGYQAVPAAWMAGCHAGLVTSTIEGFPNVILEMLAVDIPHVVSTDCAGDLEHLQAVTVCRQDSIEALARAVREGPPDSINPAWLDTAMQARHPSVYLRKLLR